MRAFAVVLALVGCALVAGSAMAADTKPPDAFIGNEGLSQRFQTQRGFVVAWDAIDDSGKIGSFDVRYRSAASFGKLRRPVRWLTHTPRVRRTFIGAPGRTYCFSVRARDLARNLSRWSTERCTAVPLDDRSLRVVDGDWRRMRRKTAYLGTSTEARSRGAMLESRRLLRARRVVLVVRRCPVCGRIEVRWSGRLLGKPTLRLDHAQARSIIRLATFRHARRGRLEIRALGGGPVRIEGIGVSLARDTR